MAAVRWRPNRVDLALTIFAALYGVSAAFTFTGISHNLLGANRPGAGAVCALGSLSLLYCRRRPILVAGFSAVVHAVAFAPMQLTIALGAAGARSRSLRRVIGICAFSVAVQIPVAAVSARGAWPSIARVLATASVFAAATAVGVFIRRYLDMTAVRTALLVAERARAELAARLDERARIAREMHDIVASRVSMMVVEAGALEVSTYRGAVWTAEMAGAIRRSGRVALEELRAMLGALSPADEDAAAGRPPAPPKGPATSSQGVDAIPDLVEAYRRSGGPATLSVKGVRRPLPGPAEHAVYRLVQESLTNVIKYAPGATVRVVLEYLDDRLAVEVANDPLAPGKSGIDLPGSGSGLNGLRRRISALGGTFEAASPPDGGFRVRAVLWYEPRPRRG